MSTNEQFDSIDTCNVFVKFLPPELSEEEFFELFSNFGEIVSSKIMIDQTSGKSLGYGFVRYATEEEALESIRKMNGQRVANKRLLCKLANQSTSGFPQKNPLLSRVLPSNNLYIKPLLIDTTEEDLREAFGVFGEILDCKVMIDKRTGQSRQIGFVRYGTVEEAQDAIEEMNGYKLSEHSLPLVVKFADSQEQKDARKKLRTRKSQDLGGNEVIYGSQPYPGMATSPYSYMYYSQSPPMYGSPPMYYPYGSYPPPVYDVNLAGYGYGYQYADYGYAYGTTPEYGYAEYGYGVTPPEYGYPAYGYNTGTEDQQESEVLPDPESTDDSVDAPEIPTESSTTRPIPIQRKR